MNRKRVYFVQPRMPWQHNPYSDPALGLLSVAAQLREKRPDLELKLLDLAHDSLEKAEIYAMGGSTLEFPTLVQISTKIKIDNPNSKIILGGVHVDAFPEEYWKKEIFRTPFDIICRGEGEATVVPAIEALESGESNKVISQQGKRLDLNEIPFPARDLLSAKHYFKPGLTFCDSRKGVGGNSTTIISSRGCPYTCSFCASPALHNKQTRFKSAERIIEELESLRNNHDVHEFRAQDDNYPLLLKRKGGPRLKDFLSENRFRYRASLRTDEQFCNEEMLKILYDSGCREVGFGIESADQKVLDINQKKTTVKQNQEAIRMAKDYNFLVRIFLMSGLPGETKDSGKRLANFIEKNKSYIDTVTLTNFIPLPGTDIFNNPGEYGIEILSRNWGSYNIAITRNDQKYPFVHTINGLTKEDMMANLEIVKKSVFDNDLSNVHVYNRSYVGEKYSSSWI